ncbi:hypothetical protein BpHYR1_049954 [Brachionus plicatilis]|uniref:Uncharacterized protein n=1 Tax=Brachionus plicatilis TaxID=10195 RepID=A0A3M7PAP8_BRAPC|nr:hypothetical protein BpHYR1_049954 [Brachionus plicatilis]
MFRMFRFLIRRGRPSKPVCGSDSSVPSDRDVQTTRPSKPAYTADLADPSGQPSRPIRPNRPTDTYYLL